MDEIMAYWNKGTVVAREVVGDWNLYVTRISDEVTDRRFGTAVCSMVKAGKGGGPLTLWHTKAGASIRGYVCEKKPDCTVSYEFDRPLAEAADWSELLAFAREVASYNFRFPEGYVDAVQTLPP